VPSKDGVSGVISAFGTLRGVLCRGSGSRGAGHKSLRETAPQIRLKEC